MIEVRVAPSGVAWQPIVGSLYSLADEHLSEGAALQVVSKCPLRRYAGILLKVWFTICKFENVLLFLPKSMIF